MVAHLFVVVAGSPMVKTGYWVRWGGGVCVLFILLITKMYIITQIASRLLCREMWFSKLLHHLFVVGTMPMANDLYTLATK